MTSEFLDPALKARFCLRTDIRPQEMCYRVLWNRAEAASFTVDGLPFTLGHQEITCLTPLQRATTAAKGSPENGLVVFAFNREFYCIQQHDHEVSCIGFLFYGAAGISRIALDEEERAKFELLYLVFVDELAIRDNIQGEMLRMLLKRLIIKCVRIARVQRLPSGINDSKLDLVRKFNVLVERHFRQKRQVSEYAEMLFKSPKTLANLFALAGQPPPLQIIHDRVATEARRLLTQTDQPAKEIAYALGFDDMAHFSHFFKRQTGLSPTAFKALCLAGNTPSSTR